MRHKDVVCFIGRLESDPVLGCTTANRKLAVLCVSTSRLPLADDDPAASETQRHRVVVWDEGEKSRSRGLKRGDRVLIHGVPAGPWKDGDLDPYEAVEFVAVSVRRLSPEAAATRSASRAELRNEIFMAARERRRAPPHQPIAARRRSPG